MLCEGAILVSKRVPCTRTWTRDKCQESVSILNTLLRLRKQYLHIQLNTVAFIYLHYICFEEIFFTINICRLNIFNTYPIRR